MEIALWIVLGITVLYLVIRIGDGLDTEGPRLSTKELAPETKEAAN